MRWSGQWTLLTAMGLAGGLVGGLLLGMPLGSILNAMVLTALVTCFVGCVLGSFQAFGLRRMLSRPGWWILATTVGIGAGLAAGVVFVEQIGILSTGSRPNIARLTPGMRAASFVGIGLIAGTVLGLAQWLVLRHAMRRMGRWVPASGAALAVALSASSMLVDLTGLRIASASGLGAFVLAAGLGFGLLTSWPWRRAATGSQKP